jgi:hypothetical protein
MKWVLTAGAAVVIALCLLFFVSTFAVGDDGGTVLVTRPGVVFHKTGASDLRGRGVEKPVAEAMAAGYVPCKVCFANHAASSKISATPSTGASSAVLGIAAPLTISAGTSFSGNDQAPDGWAYHPYGAKVRGGIDDPYRVPDTITDHGHLQQ